MELTARKPEVCSVGLDHDDAPAEALPEELGPPGVQFDRDDSRARVDERRGECAYARTDIEDQIAGADAAVSDEPFSPPGFELVPSPPPWLCHGDVPLS